VAGPTVLIVDDDDPTRTLFRIILEAEGFTCHEAGDGATALAALDEDWRGRSWPVSGRSGS
jgi:CheY-like chemotaxis protein